MGLDSRRIPAAAQEMLEKSKHIIKYTGISLRFLVEFWQRILEGKEACGLELVVAKEKLAEDVWPGRTIQVAHDKAAVQMNPEYGHVPYRRSQELQPFVRAQVASKQRSEWTIGDVCDFVVMPMVTSQRCFFIDLEIVNQEQDVGQPFEGAFVIQARSSRFQDLLSSLKAHYSHESRNGGVPGRTFLWLDLFCANQPLLTEQGSEQLMNERHDWLSKGFHVAIEQFDERIFVFDSWIHPAPLTRGWCIWEIFVAIRSAKNLSLAFPPNEDSRLVEMLTQDPDQIIQGIADLKPNKVRCFDPKDLEMIFQNVEKLGGWYELKRAIVEQLINWLMSTTDQVIQTRSSESSVEYADLLNHAGVFMSKAGKFEKALEFHQASLDIHRYLPMNKDLLKEAKVFSDKALVYTSLARYEEALSFLERALDIRQLAHGTEIHSDIAETLQDIGRVFCLQEEFDQALEQYQMSREIYLETYHTDLHKDVASVMHNMAAIYERQSKYEEALELYQQALEIRKGIYGILEHPEIAETLQNMATMYDSLGDCGKAIETYELALNVTKASCGTENHPNVAMAFRNLARFHFSQKDYEKALQNTQNVLTVQKAIYGTDEHADVEVTLSNLAVILDSQGHCSQAYKTCEQALRIQERVYGTEKRTSMALYLSIMAKTHACNRRLEEASSLYEEALVIYKASENQTHLKVAETMNNLGIICSVRGDYHQAIDFYQQSLTIASSTGDNKEHPEIVVVLNNMANAYEKLGDPLNVQETRLRALNMQNAMTTPEYRCSPTAASYKGEILDRYSMFLDESLFSSPLDTCIESVSHELRGALPKMPEFAMDTHILCAHTPDATETNQTMEAELLRGSDNHGLSVPENSVSDDNRPVQVEQSGLSVLNMLEVGVDAAKTKQAAGSPHTINDPEGSHSPMQEAVPIAKHVNEAAVKLQTEDMTNESLTKLAQWTSTEAKRTSSDQMTSGSMEETSAKQPWTKNSEKKPKRCCCF